MKIGLRTPSPKKTFKARTTGKAKRKIKSSVNPLYGKEGTGLIRNPKKSIYNKVYSKTTVSAFDVAKVNKQKNSSSSNSYHYEVVEKSSGRKKFEKILIIFFKIIGIFFILCGLLTKSTILIILSVLIAFIYPYLIKRSVKKIKVYGEEEPVVSIEKEQITKKYFDTYVAGIQAKNDKGISIQKLIKEYVAENYDNNNFEEISNKEILEYDDDIYQYDLTEYDTIRLEYEPDNEYDPNAIKIIHTDMGHIGYIPAKHTTRIKNIIEHNEVSYELTLRGGKHKYCGDDKVITETKPYYFNVSIEYK